MRLRLRRNVADIVERMQETAGVSTVYGKPVEAGKKKVIPVAKVAYGFGGGFGKEKERGEFEEGAGGGGGITARPVGIVEVTPEGTRLIQFGEKRKLAFILGLGILFGIFLGRR